MEFLALVPVLLTFLGALYLAARLIVDHEIRSAEREFGTATGDQASEVSVDSGETGVDAASPVVVAADSAGRTRGGSGAIGG